MKYLILFFALNANADFTTLSPLPPTTEVFSNYFCTGEKCLKADNKKFVIKPEEKAPCDQEALDQHSAEIGAYEITCEELETL